MTKYKNIEKYVNVQVFKAGYAISKDTWVVDADELENLLAKGVEVYGQEVSRKDTTEMRVFMYDSSIDTHSGLLIGYKPIESQEPVNIKELLEAMYGVRKGQGYDYLEKIAKRIEKNGVKND